MNVTMTREQWEKLQRAFRDLEQKLIEVAEVTPGMAHANTPEFDTLVAVQGAEESAADMGRVLREIQAENGL